MASVYTDLGPGQVTETKTVRGRTEYRVAGNGFDVWLPEHKLGFADVDHDNSVSLPYNPEPQYGVGALTDATIQPIHEIDPDKRLHPADSQSFDERSDSEAGNQPGPAPHLFAAGIQQYPTHGGMEADGQDAHDHWMGMHGDSAYEHESPYYQGDESPAGDSLDDSMLAEESGGDPNYGMGAQHWQGQDQRQQMAYRTADVLEGAPQRFTPNFIVNDTDDEFLHGEDVEEDERETTGPDGIVHFTGSNHPMHRSANPLLMALPAVAEAVGPALARGVGMGAAEGLLGGSGDDQNPQGGVDGSAPSGMDAAQDAAGKFDENNPLPIPGIEGTGWGDLTTKHGYTHNLDDRYAEIIAAHDPYDIVAQFRHDPEAVINRIGHAENEGHNPRMAQYANLVDADEMLRTAAWKDVRQKAVRLRKEGRVHVKDVGDDRIYASVQGDHGTYEVMIKKGGSFGGFGGGHAVTNWRCACEWGKWAFQRRYTFIGRLCSHGLASYHEMQSQHLKGVSQKRKRVNPRNARVATDQTREDYTIDQHVPKGELQKLRNWAEQPHDTWNHHQQEHNDDVRDAVENAREQGVDADQLVASLQLHAMGYFKTADGYNGVGTDALVNRDRQTGRGPSAGLPNGVTEDTTPVVERQNAMDSGGKPTGTYTNSDGRAVDSKGGLVSGSPADNAAQDGATYAPGDSNATSTSRDSGGVPSVKPGVDYTQSPAASAAGATGGGKDMNPAIPGSQTYSPSGGTAANPAGGGEPSTKGAPGSYSVSDVQQAAGGAADKGVEQSMNASPTAGQPGGSPAAGAGSSIGGGDYKIQSGDTLGDIAQRAGYGGDYQSLADANGISDPNKINAGDSIKIGDPKGGSEPSTTGAPGSYGQDQINQAADGAVDKAVAGASGSSSPPTPSTTPGTGQSPAPAAPAAPAATTDAIPGSGSTGSSDTTGTGAPKVDTAAATPTGGTGSPDTMTSDVGSPTDSTTSGAADPMGAAGNDAMSQGMSALSQGMDMAKSFLGSRNLEADRDWFEAAYPDEKWVPHKPFNGSGGENITEWGQSKDNVKDNYSDNFEDLTDVPAASYLKDKAPLKELREGARGITRAGNGPQREAVQPVVVRERRPRNAAVVEAHTPDFMDFDPLAPRTAASFDDPYSEAEAQQHAVMAAANGPRDIVAQFQQGGGGAVFAPVQSGGGQYDDFSDSPAIRQAMQRTAGRNYSPAEQEKLVREGDKGGAGNLSSLQLEGTHYEAMNSVGLW